MVISIIIAFRNEANKLLQCLQSLERQDLSRSCFEIICVDDGSTDGSSKIAQEGADIYVKNSGVGQVVARNEGVAHASGKYLLFIDAHTVLPENALSYFSSVLADNKLVSGVFGRYHSLHLSDKNHIRDIRRMAVFGKGDKKKLVTLDNFTTLSLAVFFTRKAVLDKISFPHSFGKSFGEDIFFQLKAHSLGHIFLYDPRVNVIHDAEINMKDLFKKMSLEIRGVENIIKQSAVELFDLNIPRLAFFLSYPLFEFLLLSLAIVSRNYYFFLLAVCYIFFRYRAVIKILTLKDYPIGLRIQTIIYLCTKEIFQFCYLPLSVIKNTQFRKRHLKYLVKTIINWSL